MGRTLLMLLLIVSSASRIDAQGIDNAGSGRAIRFDDWGDYIDLGNVYDDLAFPFTISAWIKMDRSNYIGPLFVTQDNTPWYNGFWLVITQNSISFEFGDGLGENHPIYRKGRGLSFNADLADRWVHICGVMRSRFSMDIYINGLIQASYETGESESTMASDFPEDNAKMGTWTSNGFTQFYKGLMDEVRFYNRALSQAEIQETMCRRLTGSEPGLIGYWNFDEMDGDIVNDLSPKGNHGVLSGTPVRVFSGAPLGDESFADYSNNATSVTWHGITVADIQTNAQGIQIYQVNQIPSQTEGLDVSGITAPYHGVFMANFREPISFEINRECLWTRHDNSVAKWEPALPEDLFTRIEFIPTEGLSTPIPVELGADVQMCPGEFILDPGIDPEGKRFLWSTGETSHVISVNSPGTYSLSVAEGCSVGKDEITVSFFPAPEIDLELGPDVEMCGSGPYLIDTHIEESPSRTFIWNTADNSPQITATTSGEYKVTVRDGCTTVKDSIFVNMMPISTIEVELGPDRSVCPGLQVLDPGVDSNGRSFIWSTGESAPSIIVAVPGTYSVTVIDGCGRGEDVVNVSFLPVPVIDLELGADVQVCAGSPYLIDTKLDPAGRTFTWNTQESTPQIAVTNSGVYKVVVRDGCAMAKDSVAISILPVPVIEFDLGPDIVACPDETIELAAPVAPGLSYVWNNGALEGAIFVKDAGHFSVRYTGACVEGQDDIDILRLDHVRSVERFIPNIITPNGDNKNQFFEIEKLIDKPISLQIFNRWGVQQLEATDYRNDWSGGDLADGVYFYRLRDECGHILKGTITIAH